MTYQSLEDNDESPLPFSDNSSQISNPIATPLTPGRKKQLSWLSGPKGLLIGLGLGLGLAFLASRVMPQSSAPEAAVAPTEQLASASVTVARSQTTPIRQTLSTSGTVEAFDLLSVSPRANGLQVLAVNVRTGDYVNAGDVLAVLDSAVLQAQVDQAMAQISEAQAQVAQTQAQAAQAQAALAEAQDSFNRYSTLFKQGAISEEALTSRRTQLVTAEQTVGAAAAAVDSAQSSVTRRQAEVDRAVTELQQTQVLAPESGIIAEKTATVGSVASAGTPLFQIISGEQLELSVQVPQTQLAQVNIGTPVLITSSADASLKLQGSVRSIDPTLNATREATVKVSLNKGESGSRLRAGMFLKADIVIDSRPGVVLPAEAVQPQADGRFLVYVLNENQTVTAKLVTVGDRIAANGSTPAKLEITSGLAANVPVVVEGAAYLQDGDKVDVVSDMATGADS